jgi:hypothetical protein
MKRLAERIGILLLITASTVWAQSTAQIGGTVKDQSGAILPGVEVTVTQTDTGVKRTATTDETGTYVLPNLPIGPYRLEASLPGFRTYAQTGIVLQVDANPTINAVLQVGQVSEQVEVQANAALLETRSAGIGTVVDNQRVLELPLNGRNPTELILLTGEANPNSNPGNMSSARNYPTIVINVAGGLSNGVGYLLDGAVHNDVENNLNLPLPFPDALQEFKVETSALPAQYGLHSAGMVNAVTKSGTNDFHGDAFEFVRNGIFNARDFFAPARDTLKRNQYGGVIGGPIVKNKLFFFGGYQGTSLRSTPGQYLSFIPTTAMLAGDFTAYASPACNSGMQINMPASLGFANNRISPTKFDPAAVNISKHLPTAAADPCGRVTFPLSNNQDEQVMVSRMDYTKSEKQSIFGRFLFSRLTQPPTYDGSDLLTTPSAGTSDRIYTLALGDTYLIGSGMVSSFRASVTRSAIEGNNQNIGSWSDYGVKATSLDVKVINVTVTGNGFGIGGSGPNVVGGPGGPNIVTIANTGPNYNFSEDLSMVKGTHQFGFGASYLHMENAFHSGKNSTGQFSFNGQFTGLGNADFLMGLAQSWLQGNLSTYYNREHVVGFYAQDAWRVAPRLTLNYGLRWEPYLPWSSKYGWFSHFDQKLFNQNVHSNVYVNSPAGLIFPGDSQYECGTKVECNRLSEFLPRAALAWDPKGDGRMSVRTGYGMFIDRQMVLALTGFGQDVPFGNAITLTSVQLSDPWATYPGGNPFPTVLNRNVPFPSYGSVVTHPLHAHPPMVNQWNLSVQKQVGTDWMFTANYVGSSTIHLATGNELNPASFMGLSACVINGVRYSTCSTRANTNQRRALYLSNPAQGQYYGTVSALDDGGTSNYHALFLSAQKRLSRGTTVLANYTLSHCISDLFNSIVGGAGGGGIDTGWNPGGRRLERGNCATDQRQVINLSVVAQTPRFSGRALRLIASNWQISPILKLRTGQFLTVTTGSDNALNGAAKQRPNQVLANPYLPHKSVDGWLNPAAFAAPAQGTYGNLAPLNILGPGVVQLDLALSRMFQIGEGKSIQLRAESFNLPNHLNPGAPVLALNSTGSFGQIQSDISGTSGLSDGDPRIMQFAMKFIF